METGSFARRLRNSRILRYNPSGVPVIVTAPKAWTKHDEYGLKARLPAKRRGSPFVQVTEFDSEYARPKWRPATQDALFAQRWEESGLGASTAEGNAGFVRASSFEPASRLDAEALDQLAQSQSRKRRATPDFAWLTDRDFDRYLDRLRDLRPAFQAFCEAEAEKERERSITSDPSPSSSTPVDLFASAQTDAQRGDLVIKFLSQHSEELNDAMSKRGPYVRRSTHLQPYPHPLLGLHYAPPSTFHNARFAEPLPGRLLAKTSTSRMIPRTGYHAENGPDPALWARGQSEWATSTMGIVGVTDERKLDRNASTTQWLPNETDGHRDSAAGKGLFRLDEAEIVTTLAPRASHRRSAASEPWLYESRLDELGGFRNVRRDGGAREWREHPGVPERPVKLALRQVDPHVESAVPMPGSSRWITGDAAASAVRSAPQRIDMSKYKPATTRHYTASQLARFRENMIANERAAFERMNARPGEIERQREARVAREAEAKEPMTPEQEKQAKRLAEILERLSNSIRNPKR